MLIGIVGHVRQKVADWARRAGRAVKALVEPARSVTMATAGVVRDSVMSRGDLIAENAFLRQQLIVVRRSAGRPMFVRGERFLLPWNVAFRRSG